MTKAAPVAHRLLEKDVESQRGLCSVCGPVALQYKSTQDRWYCQPAFRSRRKAQDAKRAYVNPRHRSGRPKGCQVCGRECQPVWDHDHATGEHRGWLCQQCNSALGFTEDDPERLRALADYLER